MDTKYRDLSNPLVVAPRFAAMALVWILSMAGAFSASAADSLELKEDSRLVLLGNGLGSRMMSFGYFETEVQRLHVGKRLFIRNMCDEGNTPGFRPHSGRPSPWAFPGAESFYAARSEAKDRWGSSHVGVGDYDSPDEWLTRLKPDVVVAFFGFNESFRGVGGLDRFKEELHAFVKHTKSRRYNGVNGPQLALISPIAFEDLSETHGTPDGTIANANIALYTAAMEEVAMESDTLFVNLFAVSQSWYTESAEALTRDGALLSDAGYLRLAPVLAQALFGEASESSGDARVESILTAVREKNWLWHKHYKIPNGVHVYGRRNRPFGPDNYPHELKKLEEMTGIRDQAIWAAIEGRDFDVSEADSKTHELPVIETNFRTSGRKTGNIEYRYGEDALATMKVAPGYQIELFASEREFAHLANPVQMSFDNRGRLWIATMPTYPHYQPGDPKPNDKIIILEDTDQDGKADKEIVFAGGLHLPTGFEFAPEGVYVAQGTHLMLLKDTDGDDQVDLKEIVLSGFDDHDTHHVISAFCADPSGAIFMGEGTFLHSNVETAYGPVRSSNGGFFRYDPQRRHLERSARLSIPNPWGTAFDEWGQPFFLDTSDPNMRWMSPGTVNVRYGEFAPNPPSLIEESQRVRPTSGLEFVSSRHFPDEVQGDVLLHNTIGFLGTKQHRISDDGTGYTSRFRQDLLTCSDGNFRPVDLEFAPDGSLYLLDWHNVLVGHMQHSARDPLRDHVHGRVYRITYPARPLVVRAPIEGVSIEGLLENLKLPEYRTRYRTRRELRGRASDDVLPVLRAWVRDLDSADPRMEHHLLEALWVTWGMNAVESSLLRRLLVAGDFRVRAAAVRVLRYSGHQVADQEGLLRAAVEDDHGRVRLEAIAAASWLSPNRALPIIQTTAAEGIDDWIRPVHETSLANLKGLSFESVPEPTLSAPTGSLSERARELYVKGAEVYRREGHCITCHQENGLGLPAAQFPPIAGTQWVNGDPERLIKLTLHGLFGPIEVKNKSYPGLVPMTPFKGLSDEEIASVLTYVRNTFGNRADPIFPSVVKKVRQATADQRGFLRPEELLK
jgi:mono/diheme cytochrome c family protein/glucose/arabinose dehydrogenase